MSDHSHAAHPPTRAETPEAFLADRQSFWNGFTKFTLWSVILIVLLLVANGRLPAVAATAAPKSYSRQTVASVQPSSPNSASRSGASPIEKNSSSCGGFTSVPLSMACAWPR